jgi:dynein heavy chain
MDHFKCYHHIWQKEKEETIKEFIMQRPLLSEFESQILYFQNLDQAINAEPEYICVGSIALYTGWFIVFQSHKFNSIVGSLSLD